MKLNINKTVTGLSEDLMFIVQRLRLVITDDLDDNGKHNLREDMRDTIRNFQSIIIQLED